MAHTRTRFTVMSHSCAPLPSNAAPSGWATLSDTVTGTTAAIYYNKMRPLLAAIFENHIAGATKKFPHPIACQLPESLLILVEQ